ncbi:MAG TPA: DivIVA domain-containing protein [Acidimicrobiales bacterium]|nr:DivIVA domain-containing protein [Acidimicrobiales bacterium]
MRPTPEEIEARRFRLAQNGYDCEAVDRFLAEIAEGLRAEPAADALSPDEFGRLGQEIAAILRNAHEGAGAVKAEAEGQAAALRATAEAEAHDLRKASLAEAEAIKALAAVEAQAERSAAQAEADELRTRAQAEAAEIRAEAERQLGQAAHRLAVADEQAAATRAGADREAAIRLEQAEREARERASEIAADAERRAEASLEAEQSTYLRLLAARDDLQQALERLAAHVGVHQDDPVVDLTTAPPQVRSLAHPPTAGPEAGVGERGGRPAPVSAPEPGAASSPSVAFDLESRSVGSSPLEASPGVATGDPLLRMVRAAVGRAVEASVEASVEGSSEPDAPGEVDREASAS